MITPVIILSLLVAPLVIWTLAGRSTGRKLIDPHLVGCVGLTIVLCFTGVGHFVKTEPMAEMLPSFVPGRVTLVYITGVIELVAAIAVLVPHSRRLVGWALMLMLALFLPVNIHAALNHIGMGGHQWGPIYLLIRIPLQIVLIVWTWWFAVISSTEPVRFVCKATLPKPPREIAQQILNLDKWPEFQGYSLLPGIKSAEFDLRTYNVIGSRIRVANTDGSGHVEEITHWEPDRRVGLRMQEFSAPLSRMATGFDEIWTFERGGDVTKVERSFALHPTSPVVRPFLVLISLLLRRAINDHLRQMNSRISVS